MWRLACTLLIVGFATGPSRALAECKLGQFAVLPVTMFLGQPLVDAKIDDQQLQFVADSGMFFSMMSAASAAQLKLNVTAAPKGFRMTGVGGSVAVSLATTDVLVAGSPARRMEFVVGGSETSQNGAAGLLGQNFFRAGDVEYDLGAGVIRLMRADGCKKADLAYWVPAGKSYSVIDINPSSDANSHTVGTAFINGAKVHVLFDTGAASSILSEKTAVRAGVKPGAPGWVDAGYIRGIGSGVTKTYIAPFSSFKIGDEEIRNIHLRVGDIATGEYDLILGADFFLSHRIYVATSQNKLYFTYNGGPVFNLSTTTAAALPALPSAPFASEEKSLDAAALARRGAVYAARHDYEHALADMGRACELAPDVAEYFYQRSLIYVENKQVDEALADLDHAIKVQPAYVMALTLRAELRQSRSDVAGSVADLDAAARAAAPEADVRFRLAGAYARADLLTQGIAQYDLWIATHGPDYRFSSALLERCWYSALQGDDLLKAYAQCKAALDRGWRDSAYEAKILNALGLVQLRKGDYEKAIADYNTSLKTNPKLAAAFYGRGVALIKEKRTSLGQADLATASALSPNIEVLFGKHGISP